MTVPSTKFVWTAMPTRFDSLPEQKRYADVFQAPRTTDAVNRVEIRERTRRSLQLGNVEFKEAFPGPPMPYFYLSTVLRGTPGRVVDIDYGAGRFEREMRPGSSLLVPPLAQLQMWGQGIGPANSLFVAFPASELEELLGEHAPSHTAHLFRPPTESIEDPYVTNFLKMMWAHSTEQSPANDLVIEGLFLSLMGRLMLRGESRPAELKERGGSRIVDKAVAFMRQNLSDKVSLADVAAAAGVSRPYLARVFAKQTGKTVHDHLLELRVDRAKELITSFGRNMTLSEVARQCGFANHSHLQRVFQRYVGITPQRFRE